MTEFEHRLLLAFSATLNPRKTFTRERWDKAVIAAMAVARQLPDLREAVARLDVKDPVFGNSPFGGELLSVGLFSLLIKYGSGLVCDAQTYAFAVSAPRAGRGLFRLCTPDIRRQYLKTAERFAAVINRKVPV